MKKNALLVSILFLALNMSAQGIKKEITGANAKQFKYESFANDPLKARIYTLENGLKVYMTVYKNAPRIQTYIAVKAGSKNDPADATGLAHYLEHMVFKGSDKFGTMDFSKEGPLVSQIEDLFEVYRKTSDEDKRKAIYRQIDSVSGIAAKFAIAQEYDKMLTSIGASGTNAYTSVEQTVYVNEIPSNQLEKFLTIESERFRKPVLRLFHTELEAVYEEKNRGLDNDGSKVWEALFGAMFKKHTYGTQTTIGTIEHLKNPSMKEIKKYFDAYYVPNNMAICLSGDFDPEKTIEIIAEKFGKMVSKEVPKFIPPVEDPIKSPFIKEIYGPSAANMRIAFRFNGADSEDADMLSLISKIMFNQRAGLIDLNLNQSQKVLSAAAFDVIFKDYSLHVFSGQAKEGQKLEDVKDLLLAEIEKLKKGDFPDWLVEAAKNDLKLEKTKSLEENYSRADEFVSSFTYDIPWQKYIDKSNRISKITKQQIVDFANKNYGNNYAIIYKRVGEDTSIVKVTKPQITPITVNSENESPYVKAILDAKVPEIEPVFLDFQKDIKTSMVKGNIPLLYLKNTENELFSMYYILDMGSNHNKKLKIAVDYLSYLGTSKYSSAQIREELYKLGCSFNVFSSDDRVYVSLTGLTQNFEKATKIFEHLLADAKPNVEALENLKGDILKKRANTKLSKGAILNGGLYNYGVYGKQSPYTNILTEQELKALNAEELINIIKELNSFEHKIAYYGPEETDKLIAKITEHHITPSKLKSIPKGLTFEEQATEQTQVFIVDYDMKQAEVLMISKGEQYNKDNAAIIGLYNDYFGAGMSSIVFQEMRESKALAYSVYSNYRSPAKKENSYYQMAYIGTQADKLPEAMKGMFDLLNNMPKAEKKLEAAKKSGLENIRTERITKENILFTYESSKKLGLDYDIRKDIFNKLPQLKMSDVEAFQQKNIMNKNYTLLVLGKKENLNLEILEKYGKVKFLTLEEIFGY